MEVTPESGLTDRRSGLLLVLAGLTPFTAGALYALGGGEELSAVCPFHEVTGLPCPLCGGTRAFGLAVQGDADFLHFNFFWVFAALALVLAGLAVAFTSLSFKGFWSRPRTPLLLIGGTLLIGWVTALANQSSILA